MLFELLSQLQIDVRIGLDQWYIFNKKCLNKFKIYKSIKLSDPPPKKKKYKKAVIPKKMLLYIDPNYEKGDHWVTVKIKKYIPIFCNQ